MHLSEYQRQSRKTAVYPGQGQLLGLMYATLKLNGEAGEVAEQVGKSLRDDRLVVLGEMKEQRREQILEELGDVLWYIAAVAEELGTTLDDVATTNLAKLSKRYGVR